MGEYSSGTIAPKGVYACGSCPGENPQMITLKKDSVLPECPYCGYTLWVKVA